MSRILVDQVRSNSASGDAITLDSNGKCAINATTINNLTFPTSDGSADQLIKTNGSGALSFGTVSSDMQFASWRVDTGWSGNTDKIQNFNPENNNVTMGYSSGIFSFPSTGYWHIMFQTFCYSNSDQDNIELHLMTTTNNSSYTTLSQAYGHMNNDDGGNLYTTIQVNHIFDVTDVSTHKVKFKTAGTSATFHTSAHRDESYAIFKRLAAT